jgi:hypothetical protein
MLKKHSILIGVVVAISLLSLSAAFYSGGSQKDKNAIGTIGRIIISAI